MNDVFEYLINLSSWRMIPLDEQQLEILSQINKFRLELAEQIKSSPQLHGISETVLKMHVVLTENYHTNKLNPLFQESILNVGVILKRMTDKQPTKKHNAKWPSIPLKQVHAHTNKSQGIKKGTLDIQQRKIGEDIPKKHQEVEQVKKQVEFITASLLPKGTSVRKKFVPPFKKPEPPEELKQKDGKESKYKNLQEKLVQIIESEILEKEQRVRWTDIAGLTFAKRIMNEMIIWPLLRPDIFTGVRAPPKGVLLFGPPGTGKTMIGRAIASEAAATFFSISASSLTSKWVGESEKLVKTLFAIARIKQPSVIFIDQIDSLLCSRSEGEQESSRRVKTEFLIELDGTKTSTTERVLVIGATNLPGQLDDAVRRRFVKRLYIPLPNLEGRIQLLKTLTTTGDQSANSAFKLSIDDITQLGTATRGFSGADMYSLCSEASIIPLRRISSIESLRSSDVPVTQLEHFIEALKMVRPSVNKKLLQVYQNFNSMYGSCQYSKQELEED